ncbi:MAG: glycoside hydrolase family 25 protein [Eubacteriales bacterium]|nr:glycoside hydrolase family 25 protein [Eubacteriales bacterium]
MSIHGIDVSEFQGNINWAQVKASGIQFAMLRAGYGSGTIDLQFRKNAEGCNREGIPCGVYWFSYAYTSEMARQEAEQCIETIEEYEISYPVCIDFEYASVRYAESLGVTVTRELAAEIVEAFCRRAEELGYFAMYYSNLDYLERYFDAFLRPRYALWYAQYAPEPETNGQAVWQYRDDGHVDGISGSVDMNIAYYDLAEVISRAGLNRLKEVRRTPEAAPEPNDVILKAR